MKMKTNGYIDLRKVPNEIIIGAYNRISLDYFDLDELAEEDITDFAIVLSPVFELDQKMRKDEIEKEYTELAYKVFKNLKEDFDVKDESIKKLKELRRDYQIELEVLEDYKSERNRFIEALNMFLNSLTDGKGHILMGGNFHVEGDDAEMIISKGIVEIIQTTEDGKKSSFELYNERIHKKTVDNLINEIYESSKNSGITESETPAENE